MFCIHNIHNIHACIHACMHTCIHAYMLYAYIHTSIQPYNHTYIHTYIYIHTVLKPWLCNEAFVRQLPGGWPPRREVLHLRCQERHAVGGCGWPWNEGNTHGKPWDTEKTMGKPTENFEIWFLITMLPVIWKKIGSSWEISTVLTGLLQPIEILLKVTLHLGLEGVAGWIIGGCLKSTAGGKKRTSSFLTTMVFL